MSQEKRITCEFCHFSNFPDARGSGDCRISQPVPVVIPSQHKDAIGRVSVVPMVQSLFPPVELDTWCWKAELAMPQSGVFEGASQGRLQGAISKS